MKEMKVVFFQITYPKDYANFYFSKYLVKILVLSHQLLYWNFFSYLPILWKLMASFKILQFFILYIWIMILSRIFHFWSQEETWYLWQQKSWSVVPDRVFMWQKWQSSLLSSTMLRWYLLCQIYCDIQNWGITTLKVKTAQQLKCIFESL